VEDRVEEERGGRGRLEREERLEEKVDEGEFMIRL